VKQPSLRAEDGAKFNGLVERVDGRFRASCYAETPEKKEEQTFGIFESEDEAVGWLDQNASERRFTSYRLTRVIDRQVK
jgi:hypothetical protein